MTIEEKMEHFRAISLESATTQSEKSLENYKKSLDADLETYKESALILAKESKSSKLNQIKNEYQKKLAASQISLKKDLTSTQSSIKSDIFEKVRSMIMAYRKTNDYYDLIMSQIKNIEDNYSEFDPVIYLDQDDKDLYEKVKSNTSLSVELSDKSFLGGTQTIVHKKNILIDHSFRTKLAECQNSFTVSM